MVLQVDPSRPVVQLPQHGKVFGVNLPADPSSYRPRTVEAFYSIPYALPPTGDRRFRPAQPLPPSPDAVYNATSYGPSAPGKQLLSGGPQLIYNEDCLTANIFRHQKQSHQKKDDAQLLPVMVYIHGGAFNRGTASMHNTASMVSWSKQPFIAVSFNYRIGALGFLPSSVTAKEGVLNLGLRDQIVLMEWVQNNIAAFGGDRGRVTLVGLSAGAHSIGHHLMHYKEGIEPLFHRVVIESGSPTSRAVRPFNAPIHEAQFSDFLSAAGVPSTLSPDEILPFLRTVPSEVIQEAQIAVFDKYNPSLQWAFQPVIDGEIIPRPPLETWKSGLWHRVPVMTGFQRNEGSLYVNRAMQTGAEFVDFFRTLLPLLSEEDLDTIDRLYPDPATVPDSIYKEERKGVGEQYKRIEAAYGHYAYVAPVRQTAEFASAGADGVPVYVYQWAAVSDVILGARHADNMRYEVCDPATVVVSKNQEALARAVNGYVTRFICSGDPNQEGEERWERYEGGTGKAGAMVFGLGCDELVGGGGLGQAASFVQDGWGRMECEFWWSKVDLSQQ